MLRMRDVGLEGCEYELDPEPNMRLGKGVLCGMPPPPPPAARARAIEPGEEPRGGVPNIEPPPAAGLCNAWTGLLLRLRLVSRA